ncbi:DUF2157 domain-containing protein [Marinobacterium jannaschii]|uniref:DUF2157 domain-containing protein n=1 Tax=Marinobacterium jannaschii TaxID=64970 RepID=UPI000564F1FD|nr:DUF2157 domain-containing protein [Marinobacterium jannaschii]
MRLFRLFKRDLAQEVSGWVEQGLISRDQGLSICQLYGADLDGRRNHSAGYLILITLGYLFIGLALITLIGANWEDIPRAVRMGGLVVLTLTTQGYALYSYTRAPPGGGLKVTGLFLLGNLFYGASIILIAQIYHLGEHMPDGIFWWALGSLPFGVLLRDAWLMLFSLLLAFIWFFVEFNLGFFPTLFPLFLVAAVYVLVRGGESKLLFLSAVLACFVWIEGLLSQLWQERGYGFSFSEEHFVVTVALFILAYACSHWLSLRKDHAYRDYGVVLSLWSMRFAMLVMFVLSFEEPWRELIRTGWHHAPSMWGLVGIICCMAVAIAARCQRWRQTTALSLFSILSVALLQATDQRSDAVLFQIGFNIALVCWGIYLILRGIQQGSSHYFFLGVVAVLLTAFIRYIDLIGDYVGAAIMFMVLAALLLGAAKYWKHQQRGGVSHEN